MIKGIVFDLDGVIVSTDHYHYLAWKSIADEEKIPFDEEANNRLRGVSRMASLTSSSRRPRRLIPQRKKLSWLKRKTRFTVPC